MTNYTDDQAMRRAVNRQRFLQGMPPIPDNMPVTMDARGFAQEMPLSPFTATTPSPRAPDPIPVGMSRPPLPTGVNFDMARAKHAIAMIESRGSKDPYSLLGTPTKKGDVALGKYQVMASNVKQWSREALGKEISPREFLNSPDAQEKVFEHRFSTLANQFGPKGAAMAWYGGPGYAKKMNATDIHGRLNVRDYGNTFDRHYANYQGDGTTPPTPLPTRTAELPAPRVAAAAQPLRLAPASLQDAMPSQATAYAPTPPKPAALAAIDQAIAPKPQQAAPQQRPTSPDQSEMRWQGPLGEGDSGRWERVGVAPQGSGGGLGGFMSTLLAPSRPAAAPAPRPAASTPSPQPTSSLPLAPEGFASSPTPQAVPDQPAMPAPDFANLPLSPFMQPPPNRGFPTPPPPMYQAPPMPLDQYAMPQPPWQNWWGNGMGGGGLGFGLPNFNFDLSLGG